MAVTLSLSITQNSQNIPNNTSNVTVKATVKWTYGSYNATGQCTGSLTIDGTKYSFSGIKFNTGETQSGSQVVMTKTVDVKHGSSGAKTLVCSASFVTGVSSGTISASTSKTLTIIHQASTLVVEKGTLGTKQTLTINEQVSGYKHKLFYSCLPVASGYILGGKDSFSTANSVDWTPPLSLAQKSPTQTAVVVTFTLSTYTNDGTEVGWKQYTKQYTIPASVKPSVSLAVSDPTGNKNTFDAYIQGFSKMKIVATASGNQGSTIESYKIEADGKTYTSASVETGAITGTGTLTVKATVTDSRGRTATANTTISVLPYSFPKISALAVNRCDYDADGNNYVKDGYFAVKFSSEITSLNSKNTAVYKIQHKKVTETSYTTETLTDFAGQYSVSDGVFVFPAETSSSYDILLTVSDALRNANKAITGASVGKVWSLLKKAGKIVGVAFGKVSEWEDVFEISFKTMFTGGILHPTLEPETDLNEVLTPNTYIGANLSTYNYTCGGADLPLTSGTFSLEVVGMGEEGQVKQRLTYCHKTLSKAWERIYYASTWGEWVCVSDFDGQLLWEGAYYMNENQTVRLAETVSKQRNGIVLVFSLYDKEEKVAKSQEMFEFFVPKYTIMAHSGSGRNFNLCGMFGNGVKYLYLHNDKIVGYSNNDTTEDTIGGIEYDNSRYVLRSVIGV